MIRLIVFISGKLEKYRRNDLKGCNLGLRSSNILSKDENASQLPRLIDSQRFATPY